MSEEIESELEVQDEPLELPMPQVVFHIVDEQTSDMYAMTCLMTMFGVQIYVFKNNSGDELYEASVNVGVHNGELVVEHFRHPSDDPDVYSYPLLSEALDENVPSAEAE